MRFSSPIVIVCASLLASARAFAGIHAPLTHLGDLHDTAVVLQHSGAAFLKNIASSYNHELVQHPLVTKMLTGGTLATAGDAIAQSQMIPDQPYDKRRAASFMVFDMAYRALQHVSFPVLVHQLHGQYLSAALAHTAVAQLVVSNDYYAAMEQTLASQLGLVPFLYYPVFFALTGAVQKMTLEASFDRAKENFLPLMQRNLMFWIPVQFIQFGFIDEQLQIPFLSAAGLCWTFILSAMAGSTKSYSSQSEDVPEVAPYAEETDETFSLPKTGTGATVASSS